MTRSLDCLRSTCELSAAPIGSKAPANNGFRSLGSCLETTPTVCCGFDASKSAATRIPHPNVALYGETETAKDLLVVGQLPAN